MASLSARRRISARSSGDISANLSFSSYSSRPMRKSPFACGSNCFSSHSWWVFTAARAFAIAFSRRSRSAAGSCAQVRHHEFVHQAQHARVLLDRRFGVDRRHARGHDVGAHLFEQAGQLLEPARHRAQALGQRRELAREQPVQRLPGQLRVDERVPRPVAVFFLRPDRVAQLVVEHRRVDLVRAREPGAVDRLQLAEHAPGPRQRACTAGRAQVVEFAVETVIAELRRRDRRIAAELLDEALAERVEARVRTGAGGEGCRLQHDAQRQEHQCEAPADEDVGSVHG